jgi:hypothetical protein
MKANWSVSLMVLFSILLVGTSTVDATVINVLDLTETLSFSIDGNRCVPLGTPGAACTTGGFGSGADIEFLGERAVTRSFTSVSFTGDGGTFAVVLAEPDGGVSDIVFATVSVIADPRPFLPAVFRTFFSFTSDPLSPGDLDSPLVREIIAGGFAIPEEGRLQDVSLLFRDAAGTLKRIPGDLTFAVASDIEVPEPSLLVLVGCGLGGLAGMARLRSRR